MPEMSQSTTSGGGRVTWRLRAMVRISPPWRRLCRIVRRRSITGPQRIGAQPAGAAAGRAAASGGGFRASPRRSRRRSSPRNPCAAAVRGRDTVSTASCIGGWSSSRGCGLARPGHRLGDAAAAGGARSALRLLLRLEQRHRDRLLGCRRIAPEQGEGLVEHVLRARGDASSWCAARCGPRCGCRDRPASAPAAPAIVSAGPTGSPARRSRCAKCMTLAARVGGVAGIVGRHKTAPCTCAQGEPPGGTATADGGGSKRRAVRPNSPQPAITRSRRGLCLAYQPGRLGTADLRDIVLIFQQNAECLVHRRRRQLVLVQICQRLRPVDRLGNAG